MPLIFPALLLDKGLVQTRVMLRFHSYRNIWKEKRNAWNPSIVGRALSNTMCSQQTKLSNNWRLENKATSVLADLRGSGNSLRLWFAIIHVVTLLAQVLSEFWPVLSSTLPSSARVYVDWELTLSANSLNMKSLFWVWELGYADQNYAVSAGLRAKEQSISHFICKCRHSQWALAVFDNLATSSRKSIPRLKCCTGTGEVQFLDNAQIFSVTWG